jgi:soluble lytic murein transglycosylase-like protein
MILDTEQGRVGKSAENKNGTSDYGPMQINSIWLPKLSALGISEELLKDNGCVNAAVGTWLLRYHLRETGDPLMAVSRYHSRNQKRQTKYLRSALKRAESMNIDKIIRRANGK